jgi:tetratricopeptide (TPR) repeat protein
MKKLLVTVAFALATAVSHGQEAIEKKLETLYDQSEYDELITYEKDSLHLSNKSLYLVGMGHFMKENNEKCLYFMNTILAKDSTYANAYYIKGITYNFMGTPQKGVPLLEKAIELDDQNSHYYAGLGDNHYASNNFDQALAAYEKAITLKPVQPRAFSIIPLIYHQKNESKKALTAYYKARNVIDKNSQEYLQIAYNIGLLEQLAENYDPAESSFKEVLERTPNDFETVAKLVQIHFAKKEYQQAATYKKQLYNAYKEGVLQGTNIETMFCFDQFKWQDKHIMAYERFAEPDDSGSLFTKHLFYIKDSDGNIESRIQTEHSFAVSMIKGAKYVLGMNKGKTHWTFFEATFPEKVDYVKLKKAVIDVLEGKIKSSSSSTKN